MQHPPQTPAPADTPAHSWLRQLRYWSIHCGLTALPSFCIALTFFTSLPNIAAMLCGIATFIIGYTAITSTPVYARLHGGLVGRSVRLGTRIRMVVSLIGLPFLLPLIGHDFDSAGEPMMTTFFTADFWFGYAALIITALGSEAIGLGLRNLNEETMQSQFLFPYLTTVVEGLLISISLVLIAFFTLVILNAKQRRRIARNPNLPPAG